MLWQLVSPHWKDYVGEEDSRFGEPRIEMHSVDFGDSEKGRKTQ
jgi:hypothetical protein